ncbi:MAG TPA: hypothetical protein VGC88_10880 [Terriglobales bacterium]|jgi:hypothetical protein
MNVYALRLRDGACVMVLAETESDAHSRSATLASSEEIVSVRALGSFAARFSLTDQGQFTAMLLDGPSVQDLMEHEYPMLGAARSQSFSEFGSADAKGNLEPVLYDRATVGERSGWDDRDKRLIEYAVMQERERLAN